MEFNFKVRRIIETDWEFLPSWWEGYEGWDAPIPKDMLPENGLGGFIVDKDKHPIAACWLWVTNSKTCFVNAFVADPSYRDTDREEAFDELIKFVTRFAQDMGNNYVWSWTSAPPLAKHFERNGYDLTEKNWEIVKHLDHNG